MNLVLCKFKITGLFPLLTHSPAGMKQPTAGPRIKKIPSPEEEAQAGLYIDADGNFCIRIFLSVYV